MENGKDKNGKFAMGNKPSPNRKTRGVGGRRETINIMDKMLALAGNQEKLRKDWQRIFDEAPAKFWLKYAKDILPPMTKDPKHEEGMAYTDEERSRLLTEALNIVRRRVHRQVAEDDSFVESESVEFSTN